MSYAEALLKKVATGQAKVAVIGLGYVGLPLAVEKAKAGFTVVGIDRNADRVEQVNRGENYIPDILASELASVVASGRLRATQDFSVVAEVDVVTICVPTPLDKNKQPDTSYIESVVEQSLPYLHKGQLVVLESTTYPGTTEEIILPQIESRGLKVGQDVFLAFSPERVDPGNERYKTHNTPKVVGGVTPACTAVAKALYERVIDGEIFAVSSPRVAEMEKLLENIFRIVNISLVNELAMLCERMGIDMWEVIEAAKTKPFGFMPFYPGPGLGGHCLAGTETVRARLGKTDTVLPIGKLFDRCRREEAETEVRGVTYIRPRDLRVLTIDPETAAVSWKTVSHLFRRAHRGPMAQIRLSGNYTITATDRHPMLVVDGDRLVVREARVLHPGDRIPRFAGLAGPTAIARDPQLDLLALLPQEVKAKLHVRLQGRPWAGYETLLKARFGWTVRDSIRTDSLSASRFLEIEEEVGVARQEVLLLQGKGNSHTVFPATLCLTPQFCRLLGYFLSEGCITWERGNPRVRLSFNRDETDLIDDCREILRPLGVRISLYQDRTFHTTTVRIASALLGYVLTDILRTGTDSGSMRIPTEVMTASAQHHEQLLAGLLRGDGDVYVTAGRRTYSKRGRTYSHASHSGTVGYFSSSPELLDQVESLLLGLGFRVSRKSNRPHLRLQGKEDLERLAPLLSGVKAERLRGLAAARLRNVAPRATKDWSRGRYLEVKAVDVRVGEEPVYSIEVPGTHTFATTGGVFVHNCIPLDPFYLSWKAKEYDFTTRFIELAGQVNDAMPTHVVRSSMEALNDQGKALKGAKVLLLGMAYKRDIDDLRESPALKVARLFAERGAILSYHDPYIPEFDRDGISLKSVALTPETLAAQDLVVITTGHTNVDYKAVVQHAPLIFDARNATKGIPSSKVVRLGAG